MNEVDQKLQKNEISIKTKVRKIQKVKVHDEELLDIN